MVVTRVFLADPQTAKRSALCSLLKGLNMDIVGESADWPTTVDKAPKTRVQMLFLDWDILPSDWGLQALHELRLACHNAIVVVLFDQLDARAQVARSYGADLFISKREAPIHVADRLRSFVGSLGN